MALYEAFCEWVRLCDSGKCTPEHQLDLHKAASQWNWGENQNLLRNWLKQWSGWEPEHFGRGLWLRCESTFKGRREEKNRGFENAHQEGRDAARTARSFNSFLSKGLNWDLSRSILKEIKNSDFERQLPEDPEGHSPQEAATLETWLGGLKGADTDLDRDLRARIRETVAVQSVENWLSEGRRRTLFYFCAKIKTRTFALNDARFTADRWRQLGLPGNQGERYAVMRRFESELGTFLVQTARESLATPFVQATDVDVFEARTAAGILLTDFFDRHENFLPENLRTLVLEILGNPPENE